MRFRITLSIALVLLFSSLSGSALVITESYTTDFIILYSCGYYMSVDAHPHDIGTFAAPQWNLVTNHESVHVIAHGAQGSIGEHNPMNGAQFAAWIGIPAADTNRIFADSCESGVAAPARPSLIAAAADVSRSTRSFTGYEGCAITDAPHAVERVVLPAKVDEMGAIQQHLIDTLHPQAQIDTFIHDYRQTHAGADPPLALLAQTAYANATIRRFFADLLRDGDAQHCLYPSGDGIVTQVGKLAAAKKSKRPQAQPHAH
jgi:hypothetical protein